MAYTGCPFRSVVFDEVDEMTKAITVAIPTYRRPDMLRRALESVLAQSILPDQVVVGDDAADPSVRALVRSYGERRIHYVGRRSKRRMTDNWNFVLNWPAAGYVALLEDDNYWGASHLENFRYAERTRCDIALYHSGHFEARDTPSGSAVYKVVRPQWTYDSGADTVPARWVIYDSLGAGSINASTVVVRREILDRVPPFDHRYLMGMDTLMWARIALVGAVLSDSRPTVTYTYHGRNESTMLRRDGRSSAQLSAAKALIARDAVRQGTLNWESLDRDLVLLEPATVAGISLALANRALPAFAQAWALDLLARRPEAYLFSRHLRVMRLAGPGYVRHIDRLESLRSKVLVLRRSLF